MKTPATTTIRLLLFSSMLLIAGATAAQAQDDTFAPWDVDRASEFWQKNAHGGGRDCLQTINEAMRVLYEDPGMKLGSTVDLTMAALSRIDRAKPPMVIHFLNEEGKKTTGVTEPKTLSKSVWETMVEYAEGQPNGWFMFGFSPLDGYHSIVLALDLRNRNEPKVHWADQWSSNGGWRLYEKKEELDGQIESLTNSWWNGKFRSKGVKYKSDAKIYPLMPRREPVAPQTATVERAPAGLGIPLHTKPELGPATYVLDGQGERRDAHAGDAMAVTGRQGQWVRVLLEDGTEAWIHSYFLKVTAQPDATTVTAGQDRGLSGALAASTPSPGTEASQD